MFANRNLWRSTSGQVQPAENGANVYSNAVRVVSSKSQVETRADNSSTVHTKKLLEVADEYEVKVPVLTETVKEVIQQKQIKVKTLVPQPAQELVEEEYTDYITKDRIEYKSVLVPRKTTERYTLQIPVLKTRTVNRPITIQKEVVDYQTVQVPSVEKKLVQSYRIDQIVENRIVEVTETQDYRVAEEPKSRKIVRTSDLGTVKKDFDPRYNRTADKNLITTISPNNNAGRASPAPAAVVLKQQATSSEEKELSPDRSGPITFGVRAEPSIHQFNLSRLSLGNSTQKNKLAEKNASKIHQWSLASSQLIQSPPENSYAASVAPYITSYLTATDKKLANQGNATTVLPFDARTAPKPSSFYKVPSSDPSSIAHTGLTVVDEYSRAENSVKVRVSDVAANSLASAAGILAGDYILYAHNRPAHNQAELILIINKIPGNLDLKLERDGHEKSVQLTRASVKSH
jgi:hypothetical protein